MLGSDTRVLGELTFGVWQTNCFVLADLALGTAVVVDPGQGGAGPVRSWLATRDLRCEAVLLTHAHVDHLWAAPELAADLDCPVLLHPDDRWLWDDPGAGLGASTAQLRDSVGFEWEPDDERLEEIRDGQVLRLAGYALEVRHTPGHTPGHCAFLLTDTGADDPLLLSGDLLFAGSVGRTDFPRGSWEQQMESLRAKVLPLDDATAVAPGHGPRTTVGEERRTNPYLREILSH